MPFTCHLCTSPINLGSAIARRLYQPPDSCTFRLVCVSCSLGLFRCSDCNVFANPTSHDCSACRCYFCPHTPNSRIARYGCAYNPTTSEIIPICSLCADALHRCRGCLFYVSSITIPSGNLQTGYCTTCAPQFLSTCPNCEETVPSSAMQDDLCESCYYCNCGQCGCDNCYPDSYGRCDDSECSDCSDEHSDLIHPYDYKPSPLFHDLIFLNGLAISNPASTPQPETPYLGLELEIDINSPSEAAELLTTASPTLIYCKEDSSISGVEMVTHPMTLQAAQSHLPFDTLRHLRTEYAASAYNTGIHVHVSRSGFSSDLHVFRWLKLFYRNQPDITRIARRDSAEWAPFHPTDRSNHKHLRKTRRPYPAGRQSRYAAINTTNSTTFEVRVFRGSLRKLEILASLELVHASVEYTRHLSTHAILKEDGWSWSSFIDWLSSPENSTTYPNLLSLNNTIPRPPAAAGCSCRVCTAASTTTTEEDSCAF